MGRLISERRSTCFAFQKKFFSASADEAMITLRVQDSGIGIPQDQQARIFERFTRIDQPEQGKVPGVGLGLYIAAQIVAQQGGQIWVESASGKGATVFFNLPRTLPPKAV
jgi:signal transduction histidine kinase